MSRRHSILITSTALLASAMLAASATGLAVAGSSATTAAANTGGRYVDRIFSAVDVRNDVTYATAPSLNDGMPEMLKMDVYSPSGDIVASRPVIVFIHGGGFKGGDKSLDRSGPTEYAQRGFVTVSINYRLLTNNLCQSLQDGKIIDPVQAGLVQAQCTNAITTAQHDAEGAIRWIRAHATTLGVDPTRVATIGFSAGAVTAANLAYRSQDPGDVGDFDAFDSRVQGAIAASGCEYEPASIGAGDAPMFFMHAEFDGAVPFACAVANTAAARDSGLQVETMFFYGESTHARTLYLKYQTAADLRWTAFLVKYLSLDNPVPARSQTVIVGTPNRSAVVSLVTTDNTDPGFVQVLPCGSASGSASNLNADRPFQTRAGLAVVHFDPSGQACIFNQSTTHLVVDLQGYFTEGSIDDVVDSRLVDTRTASGGPPAAPLIGGTQTTLSGRPNATAIVSLVITDTAGPGYIQVLPCGAVPGGSSNVNADRAQETVANLAFVHFDAAGHVCVYNQTAAHIVADLQAYLTDGTFDDVDDLRALDTRLGTGKRPPAGSQTTVSARPNSTAVVSLIATDSDAAGYVQALACGSLPGASSNLNVDSAHQTIANLAFVRFDTNGTACLFNQAAMNLVVDVQGYLRDGSFDDIVDVRLLDTRIAG